MSDYKLRQQKARAKLKPRYVHVSASIITKLDDKTGIVTREVGRGRTYRKPKQ